MFIADADLVSHSVLSLFGSSCICSSSGYMENGEVCSFEMLCLAPVNVWTPRKLFSTSVARFGAVANTGRSELRTPPTLPEKKVEQKLKTG